MAEKKAADQQGFLSTATKRLNLGSSGHTVDGTYMPSIAEKYKRPKTGIEKGFEQLGNFIGRVTRPPGAEGATLDNKPGIVTPSSYGVKDTKVASSSHALARHSAIITFSIDPLLSRIASRRITSSSD